MDTIKFSCRKIENHIAWGTYEVIDILINDKNLIDIIRDVEFPYAEKDGQSGWAGSYEGIFAVEFFNYLEIPDKYGYSTILGCGCGVPECAPIWVKIEKMGNYVIWKNFNSRFSSRKGWDYSQLQYKFDNQQYYEEIGKLKEKLRQKNVVSWVFTPPDGIFTVYGFGDLPNNFDEWKESRGVSSMQDAVERIVIREGITSISEWAFSGCSNLKEVTISDSIKTIGNGAFDSCNALKMIAVSWKNPLKIASEVFHNADSLSEIKLVVPQDTAYLYKQAEVWKEFNIVEKEPTLFDD
jgi:hypothetical protein